MQAKDFSVTGTGPGLAAFAVTASAHEIHSNANPVLFHVDTVSKKMEPLL
jgi:hypothetical protein